MWQRVISQIAQQLNAFCCFYGPHRRMGIPKLPPIQNHDVPTFIRRKRSAILALVDDFAYAVVSAKTLKEITSTPDDQE
jgi:hypothetical protein